MSKRTNHLLLGFSLLSLFPIAWMFRFILEESKFSVCFFYTITGKPCVFCGLSHAFAHAMHGEWLLAFYYHSFWWIAFLAVAAFAIVAFISSYAKINFISFLGRVFTSNGWLIVLFVLALSISRIIYKW